MTSLPIIDPNTPQPSAAGQSGDSGEARGRYSFISLGCPKNLVDSERMLGLLNKDGYQLTQDTEGSDFVVINTCGFIERARDESFAAINEMLELKRQGKIKGVIVSGCLAERQKDALLETCPEIDQIVGVFGREEITRVADRLVGNLEEQRSVFRPAPVRALSDRERLRITPRHFSYLKISEGCDRLCTFCAIPKMRGKHATKPMEEVIAEAEELAADGVRELIVVAQDTTYYGMDLYGEPRLAELLSKLNQVQGIDWIRLMYFYPMYVDRPLMETIAGCDKIVPYVDIPLQHINDTMLRRMSRRVTRSSTEELVGMMRDVMPDLNIRTTFITGFPGETDEQFLELADFIEKQRFERVGVFTYSKEEGTPAVKLDDHLPEELMEQRREHLMAIQQEIVFAHNEAKVGQTMDVIIDQPVPGEKTAWIGRTKADAPDVDCVTYVTAKGLKPGDIVPTEIVMYKDYDLVGVANGPAK
ncbi:30S ribosomal protein S12 methylthiotransferase RimO [Bremerella cremea]|uniref:Ribosomal protein uS12 methylthiotransferase RimO n=1 Tax=Bremerella cremea TaxID=1031537 RepID=A0A368KMB2_9BACT|nr:30S ribosomal protein S12 methylthiotransferase RimO [Bremerella cremea]RCS43219.1 30S ribosomal protein S12 methylthiotransferase RimO [Bremerella cremea]